MLTLILWIALAFVAGALFGNYVWSKINKNLK